MWHDFGAVVFDSLKAVKNAIQRLELVLPQTMVCVCLYIYTSSNKYEPYASSSEANKLMQHTLTLV